MGYYVTLVDADFTIPADKVNDTFEAMKALNSRDDLKTEGERQGGVCAARWFERMDEDYDKTCKNAEEIFDMLGFAVEAAEDGALSLVGYDNKTGSEEYFIRAIAPYVKDGSYMEWVGEDNSPERWMVKDGQMVELSAVLDAPFEPVHMKFGPA